jgi:hypothetical protein
MSVARTVHRINKRFGLRLVIWMGVLGIAAAGLCSLPLFDVLGYDYAFALGLLAAFAAADVGQGTVAAARRHMEPMGLAALVGLAVLASLSLLVVPLALSLANGLRVRNCSWDAGFAFFALLPVSTVLFAAPAGVLAGVLVRGRWGRVLAWALPIMSIAWSLVRVYRDPPVFAFDPFGGFFPGPIYDEALRPSLRLVWYRLANLTWMAAALAGLACLTDGGRAAESGPPQHRWRRPSWRLLSVTLVLFAAGCGWFAAEAALGFHLDGHDITAVLSRQTQTRHFIVHSDPGADSPEDIDLVRRDLEFRYWQLSRILGAEPRTPITVYRFSSAAQKKELTGAGGTLFAKPWKREIFVQAEAFPADRLRHELAHVFASAFGDGWFGVSLAWHRGVPRLAMGLVEGLAEAADYGDPDGRATLHQQARAMIDLDQAPPLRRILGAGFTAESGPRAYTLAGSFCRFLLERDGAAKLRALYASAGGFVGVYGRDLESLEADWRSFLQSQTPDPATLARARERFRRPAIFQKVCARELAARVSDARARLASEPEDAARLLDSVCQDDPHEPVFQLDRAEALAAAGQGEVALQALQTLDQNLTRPLRVRAANLSAAIHFHAGRFSEATADVRRALAQATDDNEERQAQVKLRALTDPESRATLGRIFFGDRVGRALDAGLIVFLVGQFADANPADPLGPYLVGRQLSTRDPKLAVRELGKACPLTAPGESPPTWTPPFAKECTRLLGESAFLSGDSPLARAAYEKLRDQGTLQADRLRADDFLERIEWESHKP